MMMNDLLEQLENGAVAVVSTRRLSRYLLDGYASFKLAQGENAWPTPTLLTWEEWAQREWVRVNRDETGASLKQVLDDQQEIQLWEKVISECVASSPESVLVQSAATSRIAHETWKLIHDWRIPLSRLANTLIEDTQAYYHWVMEFVAEMNRHSWLSTSEMTAALTGELSGKKWLPEQRLLFVGFHEWLPAQRYLVEELQSAGVDVNRVPSPQLDGRAKVVDCIDRRRELEAAAAWARSLLLAGEKGNIGVIVDDLARRRDDVDFIFDQTLHGGESLSQDSDRARSFHVSMGKPLGDYSIVDSALNLLGHMRPSIPIGEATHMLHSPFSSGGISESSQRALMDSNLRRWGWEEVSLRGLIKQADRAGATTLLDALQRAADCKLPRVQSPAGWSALFVEWLSAFGWPGERPLNSVEYQTVQAWRELISRFARLNVVMPQMGLQQAISRLGQMAGARIFQPGTGPAGVQVLGVLESSGMEFSHLWITGMSDDDWPPPLKSNPFLPYDLQREFGLPGVVAEEELTRYRGITERLLRSSANTVVSYPRQREEQTLNLSPLCRDLSPGDLIIEGETLIACQRKCRPVLERLVDQRGPTLGIEDLHGGAGIFRDQAACPFRAFARHRLDASAPAYVESGLNPMQRGNLLHWCLAGVWTEIGTQQNLDRLSAPELDEVLSRHVEAAVSKMLAQDTSRFRRDVLDIERDRMLALGREWMAIERARPGFEVERIEHRIETDLCGIAMRLRIDRIDQITGGRLAILDYKTGAKVRTDQWLDERPDDPQLPLYLVTFPDDVGAIAFAHLKKGDSSFKGLSEAANYATGIEAREDWPELRSRWRGILTDLAGQFREGVARVDPKAPTVCTNCDIKPLCRVFDTDRNQEEENG